jgi:hypothetical protein
MTHLAEWLTAYAYRSRDGRRTRRYPDRWEPASFPTPGEVFVFDGSSRVCPLCHTFLTRGRSQAVRLPRPIPVRVRLVGDHTYVSAVTGGAFYADGHCPPVPDRPRWYVHARCWDRLRKEAA